jgi:molybdopterin converting factor small subunit
MQVITALIGKINEKKQEIAEAMVNGNCVNFESYQRLVGQSIGLQTALNALNDLLEEEKKNVE